MNRREFAGHLALGAAGTALAVSTLELEGCSVVSDLETWVPVGLSAFDTLISYINPVAGSALAIAVQTANNLWAAVATAVANYQHTTDPTTTLLDKIIAAMDALQGGLSTVLANIPTGLSAAVLTAVKFGFGLLLTTLKAIQAKLEPAPAGKLQATAPINGASAAKSKGDFISQFNKQVCVASGHSARLK